MTCFTFTFLQHKLGIYLFRIRTSDSNNQNFYESFTYCSTGHPLTAEFGLISFGVGAILSFASILPCTYVKKKQKKNSSKDLGMISSSDDSTTSDGGMRTSDLIYWPSQCFSSFNLKINSEGVFWLLCGSCCVFTRFFFSRMRYKSTSYHKENSKFEEIHTSLKSWGT